MGNEIAKRYDMDEEPCASGGLACLWKIYKATDKSSGKPVSVFVYSKEDLKDVSKALREQVLVILRRELKVLEGLSARKHPSVVQHIESFEESKKLLAFATERVSCSLADAIGEGSSSLGPAAASAARRGFERYEIARGFFGLCEGLQFVHTINRRLHLNLSPESVFLAPGGQFKLGGFGFSVDLPSNGGSSTPCPYFQTGARSGFEGVWRLHPVMAFSSPEATAPAGESDVSCASDMFSLGCLMYQLCRDDPRAGRLVTADPTPQAHQTFCATLDYPGRVNVSTLFPEAQSLVTSLIERNPTARPVLGNVTINQMFHSTEVTVLKTIDGIPGRNPAEAATFLTSVRPAVSGFPLRVQRDCIMQPLMDACADETSGRLWAFALPIVTAVCERLDRREIIASVQAKFGPALQAEPLESLASLVEAMPLYLHKMEVTFFRSDVVPMVCRALQAQGDSQSTVSARKAIDVQEAALKAVSNEAFHRVIDGRTRELSILPRVCWLVVKGAAVRVKVNALLCLSKTFHFFQVRAVEDKILPTLKFCAERDETVAIQLCVLGCFDAIAKRLEKLGPVATHILPACTPMLACKGLNSNQFEMAVGIVNSMLEMVITYRRKEIANPSATSMIKNKPTHSGGVPDEEEILRQRTVALGGWKPAPTSSTSKPTSKPSSPLSSSFPETSTSPYRAPAALSPSGFDVTDLFSTPPLSTGPVGAQPSTLPGSSMPHRPGAPVAAAILGDNFGRVSDSGAGMLGGSTSASGMFEGLSVSYMKPIKDGTTTGALSSASPDPFASAGLGGRYDSTTQAPNNSGSPSGGMSWMDGAFGGGGNGGSGGMISSDVERPKQAPDGSFAAGMGGLSGVGGGSSRAPAPARGFAPPPPPKPLTGRTSRQTNAAPAGDPFAAFFDAATSENSGPVSSPNMMSSTSPTALPTTSGGSLAFMGGLGAAPSTVGGWNGGGGSGGGDVGGGGVTGGTLEDQLAKTQREIAQLTLELGAGGMTAAMGAAGGWTGMAAAMGGGSGGGGWSMPGAFTPASGLTAERSTGQAPVSQGRNAGAQDPFAFLGPNSQKKQQQPNAQGGAGSGFDFFS